MALNRGEYGGKNTTLGLAVFLIKSITRSTWWIELLSIITTERGLVPLNGFRIGRSVSLMNRSNNSLYPRIAEHHEYLA